MYTSLAEHVAQHTATYLASKQRNDGLQALDQTLADMEF